MCWCFFCTISFGQFNLVGGYSGAFTQPDNFNTIANEFNASVDSISNGLGTINWMNGVVGGFNFRKGFSSVEFRWTERFSTDRVNTFNFSPEENLNNTLNTRFWTASVGLNLHLGKLLLGASYNYDYYRLRANSGRNKIEIVEEYGSSSNFILGFHARTGKTISFSIQPYARIPWKTLDIGGLDNFLNQNGDRDIEEGFPQFGISFLFYNGRQRDD